MNLITCIVYKSPSLWNSVIVATNRLVESIGVYLLIQTCFLLVLSNHLEQCVSILAIYKDGSGDSLVCPLLK